MSLNLKNFAFVVTDYSFIFAKGSSADDKKINDPLYVKLFGFALDSEFRPCTCYIYENFSNFSLTKDDLISELNDHPIVKGQGFINNDKDYQHRLNIDNCKFTGHFDFNDVVDFE